MADREALLAQQRGDEPERPILSSQPLHGSDRLLLGRIFNKRAILAELEAEGPLAAQV